MNLLQGNLTQEQYNKNKNFIKLLDGSKVFTNGVTSPLSKLVKDIKTIKPPVPRFFESPTQLTYMYAEAEYDISAVFKILKWESYFLKATQKKHGLLTKSGLSIHSDNDEIKKYINNRFKYMHLQTGFSVETIVKQIAFYLIVCSNAFVIKVRGDSDLASSYKKDGKELKSVIGLFTPHPSSMKPKFKFIPDKAQKTGVRLILDKWVSTNRRGIQREFDPEDVAHLTLLKEDGMTFGMPEIIPVIDDIRTYRKVEEDVQLLIYRDLFPIIHYTVENPEIVDHLSGQTELDRAQKDMQRLMQDGGIATPKRHEIKFVGHEGKGIDGKPYLDHFKQRVLTGLGVSEVDLGIGENTNNGTAQTLSAQIVDSVKFIQQELAQQFKEKILDELMIQSGISDIFDIENQVVLRFEEIDIEWKIRHENHEADLYSKGVKTIHETRNKLGHKTIQDEDIDNYTFHGIQSKFQQREDQQKQQLKSAADRDSIKASKSNSNIIKHKDFKLEDSIESISIQDQFKQVIEDINKKEKKSKLDYILATKVTYDIIKTNIVNSSINGSRKACEDLGIESIDIYPNKDSMAKIDSLRDNLSDKLYSDINYINKASIRISSTNKAESNKAYNEAYAKVVLNNNIEELEIYSDKEVSLESRELIGTRINLKDNNYKLPPYHINSNLKVRVIKKPKRAKG